MDQKKIGRIEVVDALRGVALFAIVILHCFEHYNLYCIPEGTPQWLKALDKGVWDTTWFLMAGKAFSTFSLLFGLSFYIQYCNAARKGIPFKGRFVWRMFLLFLFSQFHSLFYNGDILLLYAVMGVFLVAVSGFSTRTVLVIASVMIIQPVEWIRVICTLCDIPFLEYGNNWLKYAVLAKPVMESGSFLEVVQSNITYGQLYGNLWQIENGRIFQIGGLFLFGMVAGRLSLFQNTRESMMVWKKISLWSAVLFIPLNLLRMVYPGIAKGDKALLMPLDIAVPSICNFLLMCFLVSCFVLLWYDKGNGYKFQRLFIPFGKMSLTNYIAQSVIGVSVFYGFGLNLYKSTGATACLLIAVVIFAILLAFSRFWLSCHRQGPLEWIWKKLTWINSGKQQAVNRHWVSVGGRGYQSSPFWLGFFCL